MSSWARSHGPTLWSVPISTTPLIGGIATARTASGPNGPSCRNQSICDV